MIAPNQSYALVNQAGVVVAKGSAKAMRALAKKQGGRVWLSPRAKIGEKKGS